MSMALLGPFGRIALDAPMYTLGSTPDNQLVLHDPKVSPRHALFQLQGQQYSIADLGSIDGTYLNEQRLGPNMPAFLKNGDRIRIGDTLYTFEASSLAAPAYLPTVAASSNPAYNPTVPAQQPPATPAYGQSNPAYGQAPQPPAYGQSNPAYGQAQQPPAYGQSNPAYGQAQQSPATPAYGQSNPAYGQAQQPPAYGQSNPAYDPTIQAQSPAAPAYGQSNPAYPVYGQAQPPPVAPVYGQSNVSSPGYPPYAPSTPSDPHAQTAAYTPAPGQPYAPQQPWGAGMPPGYVPPAQPQKKGGMKILLIALVVLLILGGSGATVFYIVNLPKPTMSVTSVYSVGSIQAGASSTTFTVSGKKFSHSSTITFLLDNTTVPGSSTAQSDSDGTVKTTLTVTDGWSVGAHTLTAKDAAGYATTVGVPITIVTPGQDKTPGPNGAPTDSASGTLAATLQASDGSSGTVTLKVTGGADSGTVCRSIDTGQPRTLNGTSNGDPYTETVTDTCSGTYKGGKLTYTETVTSEQLLFTGGAAQGVTCTAQTPYVVNQMDGTFTHATDSTGTFTSAGFDLTCKLGSVSKTSSVPSTQGTWTGTASMQ